MPRAASSGGRVGRPLSLRSRVARRITRTVAAASRRLGLGSGSTIGGRVGLLIDPDLLLHLGAGRPIALVSGTNGKTTTTRMLSEAIGVAKNVATSHAGANMTAGIVSALAGAPLDAVGVLEVDEAHLPAAIDGLDPSVIVLLNLSRDQLDRVSEVRLLAERWRTALAGTTATIIANADDPLVVYATSDASAVRYVATGARWREDAHHCPRCNAAIVYPEDGAGGSWACVCGFVRPEPDAWIASGAIERQGAVDFPIELRLPGRFNLANAAMATLAAEVLGVPIADAVRVIESIGEIEGRFATLEVDDRPVRLLLAKNPAGFTELLELVLVGERGRPIVIGINAQIADGHDPSWLWDVPFEILAGHHVIATGERAADLALRLVHANAGVTRIDNQRAAIARADAGVVQYIGNYTAFQALRRLADSSGGGAAQRSLPPVTPPSRAPGPSLFKHGTSALRIVVVHPDLLGTYGDGGNGRVLADRALWRGYDVELLLAPSDRPLPESADLYLLGGGEDGPQLASTASLRSGALARAVERGAVVLGVCAGYQILGTTFPAPDGAPQRGLEMLDVATLRGSPRAVGEILVTANSPAGGRTTVTGFENHGGRSVRGSGVAPLGQVTMGVGNGDGTDGAVVGRVIATYLHGPVLARNPELADDLLSLVVGRSLPPVPHDLAVVLHDERIARAASERAQGVAGAGRR